MIFRYVVHHMVEEYYAQGWVFCCVLRGHHGYWSCLMRRP